MNRILAILAVVPLTALMVWVGIGNLVFFASIFEFILGKEKELISPMFIGGLLSLIATTFYILYFIAAFKDNIRFHWWIWSLSLIWNVLLLLQNEKFSKSDPLEQMFLYASSGEAKFWIEPEIELAVSKGLNSRELKDVETQIKEKENEIREEWNRHFGEQ